MQLGVAGRICMAIFLDSALAGEAKKAFALGFVSGVTTNPRLLSQAKGMPEAVIKELCALSPGPVFYQLTAATSEEMENEAVRFHRIAPGKVVIKIPCTTQNLALMALLGSRHQIPCAATAVYSSGQAYLACEAGARYIIPYVNRISAGGGDGPAFVSRIAAIARAAGKDTQILAASLKTPDEVAATVAAGAHHVTLPLAVIEALGNDPRSDEAIRMFSGQSGK
jgi:transaldolase